MSTLAARLPPPGVARADQPSQRGMLRFLLVAMLCFAATMSMIVRCDMSTILDSADALARSHLRSAVIAGGPAHLVLPVPGGFVSIYPKFMEYALAVLMMLVDALSPAVCIGLTVALGLAAIRARVARPNWPLAASALFILALVMSIAAVSGNLHGGVLVTVHFVVTLIAALFAYALVCAMTPAGERPLRALAMGVVFGSVMLFAARCYFRDIYYVAAMLGVTVFAIRRRPRLLYLCYFIGVLIKYEHVVIALPALGVFFLLEFRAGVIGLSGLRRHAAMFAGLTVLALGIHFSLLYVAFGGHLPSMRYATNLVGPSFTTIYGLLVSPGKGMLIFCPLTLLLLRVRYRELAARREVALLLMLGGTYFCFAASLWFWDGDYCWGPRLLLLPMLLTGGVLAQAAHQFSRFTIVGFAMAGIVINLPSGLLSWCNWIQYEKQTRSPATPGDVAPEFVPHRSAADPDRLMYDQNNRYGLTVPRANLIFLPYESPVWLSYELLYRHFARPDGYAEPVLTSDALLVDLVDLLRRDRDGTSPLPPLREGNGPGP
jgi:hypothetical protein